MTFKGPSVLYLYRKQCCDIVKNRTKLVFVVILTALILVAAGCIGNNEGTEDTKQATIGYVLWDGEIASTNVMKQVLEQAGYEVEIISVDAGPLYQGLARGQFDFTTSAWLPHTHGHYMEQYGDDFVEVSTNLEGCQIGLVVPEYVTIDSIEEMNEVRDQFNGQITGIEPGAGIMTATENAIEAYDLEYELVASSSAGMAAELRTAISNGDWIVVTGWSPHWKFDRWDLKYLEDPEMVYGDEEYVATLARAGLQEDKPELYGIISRFYWTQEDIQSVMMDIEEGMSPEAAAAKWVENNPDKVNEWIGA
ncbi:MAG: glycine betaine/proline transport system substrate-binding protein [Methanolobus sp.]|jgi:glycine betaine/proline transport system substrate-binding protein|nr:glycine betaine/proline transport system substrate-binding protein [Methanolobus sp.]MDK2912774.1 glycine betaine/proline transport system substrate-binding protein [Methanolobus sp.]MDN5310936.1 glycine betaine/proline transport system substrate-binding protein [Methanolobus sp.]